ncbi:MAG: hypothetical protein C4520_00675 [Candidatus Abyssobacteria bacterium SURF_5]|uniref:Uncharacterized protein n=1 Tax=Abyssobacteria bacterium (strain SURF_5) TaxID=2093360 RepID=A0A3A4PEH0_ABYX5|nr:MAG: hypothetical protein C4520_00675 [Candidatus Abyssubacteria bacterium SURF_5]
MFWAAPGSKPADPQACYGWKKKRAPLACRAGSKLIQTNSAQILNRILDEEPPDFGRVPARAVVLEAGAFFKST